MQLAMRSSLGVSVRPHARATRVAAVRPASVRSARRFVRVRAEADGSLDSEKLLKDLQVRCLYIK